MPRLTATTCFKRPRRCLQRTRQQLSCSIIGSLARKPCEQPPCPTVKMSSWYALLQCALPDEHAGPSMRESWQAQILETHQVGGRVPGGEIGHSLLRYSSAAKRLTDPGHESRSTESPQSRCDRAQAQLLDRNVLIQEPAPVSTEPPEGDRHSTLVRLPTERPGERAKLKPGRRITDHSNFYPWVFRNWWPRWRRVCCSFPGAR